MHWPFAALNLLFSPTQPYLFVNNSVGNDLMFKECLIHFSNNPFIVEELKAHSLYMYVHSHSANTDIMIPHPTADICGVLQSSLYGFFHPGYVHKDLLLFFPIPIY